MKGDNSILQRSFRLAKEMDFFSLEELERALPEAKRETLKRYLQAMVSNGNLAKEEYYPNTKGENELILYKFISDKPIKTKIGE